MTGPLSLVVIATVGCSSPSRPVPVAAPAPPAASGHAAAIDALAAPLVDGGWAPGLVVGVLTPAGEEIRGYGVVRPGGPRPDRDTVFEIGSVTKVFTAILLAQMAGEGTVRLDQSLTELLPVAALPANGRPITLGDLATHTSGLPRLPDNLAPADPDDPYAYYSPEALYRFLSGHVLARAPGAYEYSNLGAGLLGHVLALHLGQGYERVLIDRIMAPLGMGDTSIQLSAGQRARLAAGQDAEGNPMPAWAFRSLAGCGALRSTAADMLRFVRVNLEPPAGPLGALALAHQQRVALPEARVGLGWHIGIDWDPTPGGKATLTQVRWHNGGTGGFHSFVAFDPDARVGVVVLASGSTPAVDALGAALLHLLRGEPHPLDLPATVAVAPAVLDRWVGTYQLAPGFQMAITREGERLFVQATGQPRARLFASSERDYYLRIVEARIEFHADGDQPATALTLHQNGQHLRAARLFPR